MGLTMKERRKITAETAGRYQKASKKEKSLTLNWFTELTGYNRSYASHLLSLQGRKINLKPKLRLKADLRVKVKRKRETIYDEKVKEALLFVWKILNYPSSKKLKAALKEVIPKLIQFEEILLEKDTEEKLLRISASTIDRMFQEERRKYQLKGRKLTKPGNLLKNQIPIRTFSEWNEEKPGFLEMDLVGHEGGNLKGEFLQTLTAVDIHTSWLQLAALKNKAQKWVYEAIEEMRKRLPFELLGIDSDNGAEFINAHLMRYCQEHKITFTRSRKYRKNDNCYVEEKNNSVVRNYVGYMRFDTEEELELLKDLYTYLELQVNFFLPVMKCREKVRIGSKLRKRYDAPRTPYQRVLESEEVKGEKKKILKKIYRKLNPAELARRITELQDALLKQVLLKEERRKNMKAAPLKGKKSRETSLVFN